MYTNCNNLSIVILNMNSLLYLSTAVVDFIYSIYILYFSSIFLNIFFPIKLKDPKKDRSSPKGRVVCLQFPNQECIFLFRQVPAAAAPK